MSAHVQRIESAQNDKLKRASKWIAQSPSRLKAEGLAWCEGLHLSIEVLKKAPDTVSEIWLPEGLWNNAEWQEHSMLADHVDTFEVPDSLYKKLSGLPSPTGPTVFFKPTQTAQQIGKSDHWVILDCIQDPGNLGTMLRTCAAAGIKHIGLTNGSAWPWGEKALRAGMGAQWGVNLVEETKIPAFENHQVLATHLSEQSVSLFDCDLTKPTVWVFGNEGQGVSENWISRANASIRIPQAKGVESLNVAASCAVVLFEQMRQTSK